MAWDGRVGGGTAAKSRAQQQTEVLDYVDAELARAVATQQAANYTLVLADAGKVLEGTKATGQTVTVPPNASVAFPVGTVIEVCQYGAGQITLTPGAGVTLTPPTGASLLTRAQYSTVGLRKRATNEWIVSGDLQ